MIFRFEISPSNVTECSFCSSKIKKGTLRLNKVNGQFNGKPTFIYFCDKCAIDRIIEEIEELEELKFDYKKKLRQLDDERKN